MVNATSDFVEKVKPFKNAVVHTINGILTESDVDVLKNNNLKILVLGYKQLRRGVDFYSNNKDEIVKNQKWLYDNIGHLTELFDAVSFDNLAIEQLDIRRLMTEDEWNEFYMGDDGTVTFYIDLVENKFAKNSLSQERYDLLDSIDDMFNVIISKNATA